MEKDYICDCKTPEVITEHGINFCMKCKNEVEVIKTWSKKELNIKFIIANVIMHMQDEGFREVYNKNQWSVNDIANGQMHSNSVLIEKLSTPSPDLLEKAKREAEELYPFKNVKPYLKATNEAFVKAERKAYIKGRLKTN